MKGELCPRKNFWKQGSGWAWECLNPALPPPLMDPHPHVWQARERGGCGPARPHVLRLTSLQVCLLWSGPPSLTGCSPAELELDFLQMQCGSQGDEVSPRVSCLESSWGASGESALRITRGTNWSWLSWVSDIESGGRWGLASELSMQWS